MKAVKTLLFAVGVAAVLVTVAGAGGSASAVGVHGLKIRNGVIHGCYETKGDATTRGDLKLFSTNKSCKPISWNLKGPKGATGPSGPGANGPSGPAGPAGANGAAGAAGAAGAKGNKGGQGDKGDKGDKGDPGAPAPTMLRLSGDFSGTNASVATSLDGVQFGPYPDGGTWGGSVLYKGANGKKLSEITQLSYTVEHSSGDDSPISSPYLRIFLKDSENVEHDVVFDATKCATVVPTEDEFHTYEVVGSDVRYDDDSCDGVAPDQQPYATVLAAHGNETVTGIYVTTGFAGGKPLAAILRTLKFNSTAYTFGAP